MIKITYYGHSMWKVSNKNHSVVLDPFEDIGYPMPQNLRANIVCSSHNHYDHNNFSLVQGEFYKINQAGHLSDKDITIDSIQTFHDHEFGEKRGLNLITKIRIDDVVIVHCGDLGHLPDQQIIDQLLPTDILMIPIGGTYTLDSNEAKQLCDMINPKLILPMHFKNQCCHINIKDHSEFIRMYSNVSYLKNNFIEVDKSLMKEQQVILFNYQEGLK